MPAPEGSQKDQGKRFPWSFTFTIGTVVKLLLLGGLNVLAIWSFPSMWSQRWWPGLIAVLASTALIDWAYLSPKRLPAKYLVPGTIFALIFAVVPVIYNAYIAFTNFGTGNVLTREQAVENISGRTSTVPGSTQFKLTVLAADDGLGEFALLLENDLNEQFLGTDDEFLQLAPGDVITDDAGKVLEVAGFAALNLRQLADRQGELTDLEVERDEGGVIKVVTVTTAAVYEPLFTYDEDAGTFTDIETGVVYTEIEGTFTSPDGQTLTPGFRAFIGWDNFTRIITAEEIRGPFLRVFLWNYFFAIVSTAINFIVGLGLALALNHATMRGKRIYRSLLIIPYAIPSFVSALVWQGMLNQRFGIINELLNADIAWLRDPTLAKVSVIVVNLWLTFPYMFLIATGALQAIPADTQEAARVDGANPSQVFRLVTFPLLMVTLAPLLIAAFAFAFNNFNIIYYVTGGDPPIAGAQTPAGHTDILISYTFRLAFETGRGSDFGLAAAIASLIFIMVATVSAISFKRTAALEELT
ncbi:MAG: maltose ABC transporter permease MalF [bacterium]|nr:maltose ABC transporter permease MalF [bacterium]